MHFSGAVYSAQMRIQLYSYPSLQYSWCDSFLLRMTSFLDIVHGLFPGLFEDTVLCLEVVTGDGELKWVSRDIEPDLFYGIFGSFGSIALVTCAVLRCVPARRWKPPRLFLSLTWFRVGISIFSLSFLCLVLFFPSDWHVFLIDYCSFLRFV